MLLDFAMTFVESQAKAIESIAEIIPETLDKLNWAMDLKWPYDTDAFIPDKDRILYQAVLDAVALISADFRAKLAFMRNEIELLLHIRETVGTPKKSALEYIYWMEQCRMEEIGQHFYLENPMRSFYGALPTEEVAELYEIDAIDDLLRFEFIEMVKHDIFIKKCKNCGSFFMPKRRVDAEYCDRIIGESKRKCSEIGAVLRYERKVAENPILEAYSKAYKRFNSRTRAKKMTQGEFLSWSEQARQLRDECVAGKLSFEEFSAWLEQGRIRKGRGKTPGNIPR
jgi:hypothetical protein